MDKYQQVCLVFLAATFLSLSVTATPGYDEAYCEYQLSRRNQHYTNTTITPYFYNDYSVLREATFMKVYKKTKAMVTHQQLYYSKSKKQVVVYEEKPDNSFWVFVDQDSQDCIYKNNTEECSVEEGDCKVTAKEVGFGNKVGDTIVLGSPSERMAFPTNVKKTVSFGGSWERNVKTTKLGLCSHREDTDETVVSFVHLFDPTEYTEMDQTRQTLLSITNFAKTPDARNPAIHSIDFTNLKPLSSAQLKNGFHLGESRCGMVKSKFTSRKIPKPSPRFSYTNQEFLADPTSFRASEIQTAYHEDNLNSQLNTKTTGVLVADQTEKNTLYTIQDFNARILYKLSLTYGRCEVQPLSPDLAKQPRSEDIWQLNLPNPTYLGVYQNREIPCDVWLFEAPKDNSDIQSTTIYTATRDWLKSQKLPTNMFFPVEKIEKSDKGAVFQEIYNFRDNPGYDIPEVPSCFQEDDMVSLRIVLLVDFENKILGHWEHFNYELRTLIMRITGIKSPIRIGSITATKSTTSSDQETVVGLKIYGKFKGHNDSNDDFYYHNDPVTSKQAAELIRKQVDTGNFKLTLDKQNIGIKFKKGSFAVSESGNRFRYVDSSNTLDGFSRGTMAGAGLGVLFTCLALALAAVYGYKRWTQGRESGSSIGMKTLQEEH
ncbi:EF-hand domain-containing protein D1 [Elysia marginata]|uniref:EF-hand domain-containing protein D1 n=1 Tax=Elysia marginata TaxID=1093978 RepID=A0AAV4I480_9GAST|nr:EF-hand domain-containing protein D1 [Elysia marginata]